jgi:hypothetical protein
MGARAVLEAVQQRLDKNPQAMRQRRQTAEHSFATLRMRMGATHFLMKRLPKVATEMALHVLAYNLSRVMNIIGVQPLVAVANKPANAHVTRRATFLRDLIGREIREAHVGHREMLQVRWEVLRVRL